MSVTTYYNTLLDDVRDKEAAGFNTSITDYWGRSLSFQLFNSSTGAPGERMGMSLPNSSFFSDTCQ